MVPLDDGFLQVVADAGSDMRVIIRYDSDLTMVTHRTVDAPLGPLATDVNQRLALIYRRSVHPELVWYSWSWKLL